MQGPCAQKINEVKAKVRDATQPLRLRPLCMEHDNRQQNHFLLLIYLNIV